MPAPTRARVHVDLAITLATFAVLWLLLWRHLSGEWSMNEQYNYGWFVPFFAAYLFWLRWEDKPKGGGREAKGGQFFLLFTVAFLLLLLLPLRVFEIGNPDWRPLGWIHALIVVALTYIYIGAIGGSAWVRHFGFPIAFTLVAVPWISPIEQPIVQELMRAVAAAAAETMTLFGIPTQLEGNLIRVPTGLVGVNEACSGVRSLQTSIMIGLLFGELRRLSILRRVVLIAGAIAIALVANFARTLALVWIAASRGTEQSEHWHDVAGYLIVVFVFVGTMVLASKLTTANAGGSPEKSRDLPFVGLGSSIFAAALVWMILVEVAAASWYRAHEQNLAPSARWEVRWPEAAPGFRELKIPEGIRSTLRFDRGREVMWRESAASPAAATYLLYFFKWQPRRSTILRARAHRPDICLPAAGWRQTADEGIRSYPVNDTFALPLRHFVFAHEGGMRARPAFAHTFFCLRENAIHQDEAAQLMTNRPGDWSPIQRWHVVRDGIRNPGQQVMEFIMISPRARPSDEVEGELTRMLPTLVVVRN